MKYRVWFVCGKCGKRFTVLFYYVGNPDAARERAAMWIQWRDYITIEKVGRAY